MSTSLAPVQPVNADHFAAALCRNCGAPLEHAFCGKCGQKKAKRLELDTVAGEAWDKVRLFEFDTLVSIGRVMLGPGRVAREYVLGARKKHVHPLKLLLIAIGVLLLVLTQSRYLNSASSEVSRAMALAQSYGQWSFSLGIVAIVLASSICFWRRLGYNLAEHLVLAVYTHFLIIAASIVSLLPTLLYRAPAFLQAHKAYSAGFMDIVEALIVAVAFRQFFVVDLRRDGWRLLLGVAVFAASKWLLLQAFAWALVRLVLVGMG